ncbi:MAG: hypothetical protein K6L81_06190 [Agarilytica sp.]
MNLNQWKKKGVISLWAHEPKNKNFPGWHLHANAEGYNSIVEYLSLLFESPMESWRTMTLDVLGNGELLGNPKDQVPVRKLVIRQHENENGWHFEEIDRKVFFSIGVNNLEKVFRGIDLARAGERDFSIGPKNRESLWFW